MTKKEILTIVNHTLEMHALQGEDAFLFSLEEQILDQRIKFPYHEYTGELLLKHFGLTDIIPISDKINQLEYEGSYVQNGKILQILLDQNFDLANKKAVEYILNGNVWFACDIISDRVFGYGLNIDFERQLQFLKKYITHENQWIQRAPGIAVHVAVKNGVTDDKAIQLFDLMMLQITQSNYFVKKGCGWGIETILKFHPHLGDSYKDKIFNTPDTNSWIKRKFEMGLKKADIRNLKSSK